MTVPGSFAGDGTWPTSYSIRKRRPQQGRHSRFSGDP